MDLKPLAPWDTAPSAPAIGDPTAASAFTHREIFQRLPRLGWPGLSAPGRGFPGLVIS